MIDQFACPEDIWTLRNVINSKAAGTESCCFESNFVCLAWLYQQEIVRHKVDISERQLDLFAGSYRQLLDVIEHAFLNRSDSNRGEVRRIA